MGCRKQTQRQYLYLEYEQLLHSTVPTVGGLVIISVLFTGDLTNYYIQEDRRLLEKQLA